MKKHAYYNKITETFDYFTKKEADELDKDIWEMVPSMENFINDDGQHQVRLHFEDYTVDLIETDVDLPEDQNIIEDVEVVDDGNRNTE